MINSVAARRDAASTPVLIKILGEDPESAAAAAKALGEIGTSEAAKALVAARGKGPAPVQQAVVDGTLICADRLVAAGQRSQAITLLEGLTEASQPEHVRVAAKRTLSAVTRKSLAARHRHGEEAQGENREVAPILVRLFPSACSVPASRPSGAGTARQRATCKRVSRSHDGRDLFSEDRYSPKTNWKLPVFTMWIGRSAPASIASKGSCPPGTRTRSSLDSTDPRASNRSPSRPRRSRCSSGRLDVGVLTGRRARRHDRTAG